MYIGPTVYHSEDFARHPAMVIRSASRRVGPSAVTSSVDGDVSSLCQLAGMQECTKGIRELNKEVARYCTLLISVGTTQDCAMVRKELTEIHRRTVILAYQTKDHMLPHLRGRNSNKTELEKFEKMWNDYSCCIELVVAQLWKTFHLVSRFPVKSATFGHGLIRTGLTEKIVFQRRWAIVMAGLTAVVEPSLAGVGHPLTHGHHAGHDNDETRLIKKAIAETSELLKSIHDVVDIKPWTIKSTVDPEFLFDIENTSISGGSEVAVDRSPSHTRVAVAGRRFRGMCCIRGGGRGGGPGEGRGDGEGRGATLDADKRRRRRRLCLLIVIFVVCLVALSTVIAVCLKRFL